MTIAPALNCRLGLSEVKAENLRTLVVVCAYNEEASIAVPVSRAVKEGFPVLVVDDGSEDRTSEIAKAQGAVVVRNPERMGKAQALNRAISYAKDHGYEAIIEIDADAVPTDKSITKLYRYLTLPNVAAVSARQIPIGNGIAYKIDELVWRILAIGKSLQQRLNRPVHLGAVMYGVKLKYVKEVVEVVNDDEFVGIIVLREGGRTYFADDVIVYFDASSSIKHLFARRKRMILGHLQLGKSTAPSMQPKILAIATLLAICEKKSRMVWFFPAAAIEMAAHLSARATARKVWRLKEYVRWHTQGLKRPLRIEVT